MFFLHFALVFYETPERGKLARQVESCWRSSDRWRWFLLPLKVLKLALEDSWMFIHILITFLWAHWKYLFLIALSFCQVCNPFNHLSRTFCFGCGLRSFWENPIKSGTGVLRWVSGGEGSPDYLCSWYLNTLALCIILHLHTWFPGSYSTKDLPTLTRHRGFWIPVIEIHQHIKI